MSEPPYPFHAPYYENNNERQEQQQQQQQQFYNNSSNSLNAYFPPPSSLLPKAQKIIPPKASTSKLKPPVPPPTFPITKPPNKNAPVKAKLPEGAIVLQKSCARCRIRKVKCDRLFPTCTNCIERKEDCDLINIPTRKRPAHTFSEIPENERIARLERRLEELETQLSGAEGTSIDVMESLVKASQVGQVGHNSVDWSLARPQMAKSLSQHLCDAFFDSCCAFLPSFTYFRNKLPDYKGNSASLSPAAKVAIAAFCTIGARASPHSAVLGIELAHSTPNNAPGPTSALLLSAGTRRQNACSKLLNQAHTLSHEESIMDEVSEENLAALMALVQLAIFAELQPKRSRTLLRAALSQYKELIDSATSEEQRMELKQAFALGLYSTDALISSYARRLPLISSEDLKKYFHNIGIVVPNLAVDDLPSTLARVLGSSLTYDVNIKTACHLLTCWTSACHRAFAEFSAPPGKSTEEYEPLILAMWAAIDQARAAVQIVQSHLYSMPNPNPTSPHDSASYSHPHFHSHSHDSPHSHSHSDPNEPHFHETDYIMQVIRQDRDLLDLYSMMHTFLINLRAPGLPNLFRESNTKVRKGLKTLAFYSKIYLGGADAHMLFHHTFQMEHNPKWTKMALQRVGEVDGPLDHSEEVLENELTWLIEGLELACYYMPSAGKRLNELTQRFTHVEHRPDSPPPVPTIINPVYPASFPLPLPLAPQNSVTYLSYPTPLVPAPRNPNEESMFTYSVPPTHIPNQQSHQQQSQQPQQQQQLHHQYEHNQQQQQHHQHHQPNQTHYVQSNVQYGTEKNNWNNGSQYGYRT